MSSATLPASTGSLTTSATPAATPAAETTTAPAVTAPAASTPAPAAATTITTPPATPPAGAPEKYEFKAPQGQQFNEAVLKTYGDAAKKLNLTQDGAQALLDQIAPVLQAEQSKQIDTIRAQWREQTRTDKEIGGDKLRENLAVAKSALDRFGSPELTKLLDETDLGSHPELIRMLYRAGKAISQDGFMARVLGDAKGEPSEAELLNTLYPTHKK